MGRLSGRLSPVLLATIGMFVFAASASAQTTTFGADLSQAPTTTFDCTRFPNGIPTAQPSCTWTTPVNPVAASQGLLTPAGAGTINTVRLRVGPITGQMQIVVLTVEVNPSTDPPKVSCCTAAYVGPTFTPTPNAVTTLQTDLPVRTDGPGEESSPGLQVGDILALSILEDGVPIPAIDETHSGLPANLQPSDDATFPAYVQGETALTNGGFGYQLDMNADWTPLPSSTNPPPPTVTPPPSTVTPPPAVKPIPTVTFTGGAPTVNRGRVDVTLACAKATACDGTLAVESAPLTGAQTAASHGKPKKPIVYASGPIKLAAGARGAVAAKLTASGRAAARAHRRLTTYLDITLGSGSSARKFSHKVAFRF